MFLLVSPLFPLLQLLPALRLVLERNTFTLFFLLRLTRLRLRVVVFFLRFIPFLLFLRFRFLRFFFFLRVCFFLDFLLSDFALLRSSAVNPSSSTTSMCFFEFSSFFPFSSLFSSFFPSLFLSLKTDFQKFLTPSNQEPATIILVLLSDF